MPGLLDIVRIGELYDNLSIRDLRRLALVCKVIRLAVTGLKVNPQISKFHTAKCPRRFVNQPCNCCHECADCATTLPRPLLVRRNASPHELTITSLVCRFGCKFACYKCGRGYMDSIDFYRAPLFDNHGTVYCDRCSPKDAKQLTPKWSGMTMERYRLNYCIEARGPDRIPDKYSKRFNIPSLDQIYDVWTAAEFRKKVREVCPQYYNELCYRVPVSVFGGRGSVY